MGKSGFFCIQTVIQVTLKIQWDLGWIKTYLLILLGRSDEYYLSNPADQQTDSHENVTSLAEVEKVI